MGRTISKFSKALSSVGDKKEIRIVMVGLDSAGKSTILYKLKLGEVVTTIPTIGMLFTRITDHPFPNISIGAPVGY